MLTTTVTKRFNIASAHFLPGYPGKCANMHGHTWDIEITIAGTVGSNGILIDFSSIKSILVEPLKELLDHKILNEQKLDDWNLDNPTAENLASAILIWCNTRLSSHLAKTDHIVSSVKVWESPDSYATVYWSPEDN